MKYKHNKTGNIYIHLAIASNATNGKNDGELMVVYCPCDNENSIYVRNQEEFENKFTMIDKI